MSRNPISDQLQRLVTSLKLTGENYRLINRSDVEYEAVASWLETTFPISSWGRIDWGRVPDARCSSWSSTADLVYQLQQLADFPKVQHEVAVMWTDDEKPLIMLPFRAVLRHAARVVEVDWDCWIFDPNDAWCIEVYHEEELCYGIAPWAPGSQCI